ncbi:MAG: SinR family protein [Nitrosospira sp.]
MATYLIGYDLNKSGQNYPSLIKAIESYGTYWHCLDSTWLIKANGPAIDIVNNLNQFIDSNDELFVTEIAQRPDAAWIGFDTECSNWLGEHL